MVLLSRCRNYIYQAVNGLQVVLAIGQPLNSEDGVIASFISVRQDRTVEARKLRMPLLLWPHRGVTSISPATSYEFLMPREPSRRPSIILSNPWRCLRIREQTLVVRFDVDHALTVFIYMNPAALMIIPIALLHLLMLTLLQSRRSRWNWLKGTLAISKSWQLYTIKPALRCRYLKISSQFALQLVLWFKSSGCMPQILLRIKIVK